MPNRMFQGIDIDRDAGYGVIASTTLLPSADVEGSRRERTHCPSTFHYAYSYDTPSKYSDILAQYGGAHACSRMCAPSHMPDEQLNAKHPYCASTHAPSCVASGLIIPLVEYYQPKVDRIVRMTECGDFPTVADVIGVLNEALKKAPDFAEVPVINGASEIFTCKTGVKICPEADAEELVYVADQEKSIIDVISKHKEDLWKKRVEAFKSWYKPSWLKGKGSWEDNAQGNAGGSGHAQGWKTGSSKRAYSAPAKRPSKEHKELDRATGPYETPLKNIGEANLDNDFLFLETESTASAQSTRISASTQRRRKQNICCGFNRLSQT